MRQWINTDFNRFAYIAYLFIMAKYRLRTDLLTWLICLLLWINIIQYLGRKATFRAIGYKANLSEAIVFKNMNSHCPASSGKEKTKCV